MRFFSMIVFLSLLTSCAVSYLKKTPEKLTRLQDSKSGFKVGFTLNSDMSQSNHSYWFELIKEELFFNTGMYLCEYQQDCDCSLEINIADDQSNWSSWKVYVSGLSVGLVPIKFKAEYSAKVITQKNVFKYENTIFTWTHLGLLPIFFVLPTKERISGELVRDVRELVEMKCDGVL